MDVNFSSSFLSLCADASGDSNTTSELWLVEDKTSAQVAASFLLLILVVGLPWNLLVVGIILKKKLYTQPTVILLLNLVLTDIFMLILQVPFQVWVGFNGEYKYGGTDSIRCKACQLGVLVILFPLTSLYTISYMSFDRFLFIYKPLKYNHIITCFRILLVLCLTWVLIALLAILPLVKYGDELFNQYQLICAFDHSLDRNRYLIVVLAAALLPMVPILVFNVWLSCIVRKNIKAIYSVRRSPSSAAHRREEDNFYHVMKKQRHQKQLHLVWVFGALLCCNLVTWLPIIIRGLLFAVEVDFPGGYSTATTVLFTFQTLLHPIVESVLIKEVREPQKMIMLYCCVKIKSKMSSSVPKHDENSNECSGYCAQSHGCNGCGLLDICNTAVLMNCPKSDNADPLPYVLAS